ncbi:BON domain-containing protein [Leifsonia sp. YAF41]|uniref:BON domain-containing protein n=1 Tax=Leifsonia sp. YAF41 TaxID=3233086 RepID=UPI003F99DD4C
MSPSTIFHSYDDRAIQHAVESELSWAPDVASEHIGVAVEDGAVTLSGVVRSLGERGAAVRAAQRVRGVTVVTGDLTVRDNQTSDNDLSTAVNTTLTWLDGVPEGAIKAEIHDGKVVLTGTVDWHYLRLEAKKAIERLSGVRAVESRIELTRKPRSDDVVEELTNAFVRNAILDAERIHVAVDGTELTLTGNVRSWAEKRQAVHTAWASPHVSAVHDELQIIPT